MALPSNLTRSPPSPASPSIGRTLVFNSTTLPPFLMSTSNGASSQLNAIPNRCSFFGSGISKFSSSLTIPLPEWFPTKAFTAFSSKSHARLTTSVENPVKIPLEPVRKKSVNSPALCAFEVSPKKRTTNSVSSLLYHHVTAPKGRAMASPFLIARTFSSDSGSTIPATPFPTENQWGLS